MGTSCVTVLGVARGAVRRPPGVAAAWLACVGFWSGRGGVATGWRDGWRRAIPSSDLPRVLERISGLSSDPRPPGCQKLSAQERYRIRCGRYRVIYEIRDGELVVLAVEVAQRKDV